MLLTFLMSILNLNAQKLAVDKVESDGSRTIVSYAYPFYKDIMSGDYAEFNVGCIAHNENKSFYITFNICDKYRTVNIEKGRKLLVKLENDSIIESYNEFSHSTNSSYLLSEEQIKKILNGNVVKIRIERDVDVIDKEIRKNKFSKRVKEAYDNIIKALQTSKDIYSDF